MFGASVLRARLLLPGGFPSCRHLECGVSDNKTFLRLSERWLRILFSPHASASRRLHCLRSGAVLETHGQTATKTARSGLRDGRTHSKKDGQTCLFVLCVTIFVGSSSIQVTSSVSVTPVVSRSAQLMWTMIFSERFQRLKTFRVLQRLPLAELRLSRATRL